MKNHVIVDGIPLSRDQVERALQQLNWTPQPGDHVRVKNAGPAEHVVVQGEVHRIMCKHYHHNGLEPGFVTLINLVTGDSLTHVGFNEIELVQ